MDEDQTNETQTEPDDFLSSIEQAQDDARDEVADAYAEGEEAEAEETEPEAQAETTVAAPFRPNFDNPVLAQSETYLRENLGDDLFNAIDTHFASRYANSRQAESVADHYTRQIDEAAPGFLTPAEHGFIRGLPPVQQADPGATFLATAARYVQQAQTTGDVAGAMDALAQDWLERREGRRPSTPQRTAPAVLPPSQRVGGGRVAGGATSRPATRAGREEVSDAERFLQKTIGLKPSEAARIVKEF